MVIGEVWWLEKHFLFMWNLVINESLLLKDTVISELLWKKEILISEPWWLKYSDKTYAVWW